MVAKLDVQINFRLKSNLGQIDLENLWNRAIESGQVPAAKSTNVLNQIPSCYNGWVSDRKSEDDNLMKRRGNHGGGEMGVLKASVWMLMWRKEGGGRGGGADFQTWETSHNVQKRLFWWKSWREISEQVQSLEVANKSKLLLPDLSFQCPACCSTESNLKWKFQRKQE